MGATATTSGVLTSSAEAYTHSWSCGAASGSQCYDNTGIRYNYWRGIYANMSAVSSTVCAKSITEHGNIKNGSGCNYNTTSRASCVDPGDPTNYAYVYWAGAGTIRQINGVAQTSATSIPPC